MKQYIYCMKEYIYYFEAAFCVKILKTMNQWERKLEIPEYEKHKREVQILDQKLSEIRKRMRAY